MNMNHEFRKLENVTIRRIVELNQKKRKKNNNKSLQLAVMMMMMMTTSHQPLPMKKNEC